MFDSTEKIQEFILWCQKNKVKSFKIKDIEFHLSELSFIPQNDELEEINLSDQKTFSDFDNMTREEQEELLFWSANKKPHQG